MEVTEASRFYLRHGRHPDVAEPADRGEPSACVEPSASYGERPVARTVAGTAEQAGELSEAVRLCSRASDLFRGEPLAGLPGSLAELERLRLVERRVTLVQRRADWQLRLGRVAEAIAALSALAREQSLNEPVAALLMRALGRGGRRAEASAVFDCTVGRLAADLGVAPGRTAAPGTLGDPARGRPGARSGRCGMNGGDHPGPGRGVAAGEGPRSRRPGRPRQATHHLSRAVAPGHRPRGAGRGPAGCPPPAVLPKRLPKGFGSRANCCPDGPASAGGVRQDCDFLVVRGFACRRRDRSDHWRPGASPMVHVMVEPRAGRDPAHAATAPLWRGSSERATKGSRPPARQALLETGPTVPPGPPRLEIDGASLRHARAKKTIPASCH